MEKIKSLAKHFQLDLTRKQLAIVAIAFFLLAAGMVTAAGANKSVKIVVKPDGIEASREINASLLADVQKTVVGEGYDLEKEYTLEVAEGKRIKDVDVITLTKTPSGVVKVDGQEYQYTSKAKNVEALLAELKITVDGDDVVTPAKETALSHDFKEIVINRVEVKEEPRDEEIAFETEEESTSDLDEGETKVATPGVPGMRHIVDRVTYRDGVEVGRETIANDVTLEPVKEVVQVGKAKSSAPADRGSYSGESPQGIAQKLLAEYGWSDQWDSFNALIQKESGWNPYACNSSSGAYGLGQALPGSKMASVGSDWETNPETQLRWTLGYIAGRYGDPDGAWSAFQSKGWY